MLALASMPLLFLQHFIFRQPASRQSYLRMTFFLMPFYLWLAIMTPQPHKEERFMYPIYPALALNAAVSLHIILSYIGHPTAGSLIWRIPSWLKFLGVVTFGLVAVTLGLLRTASMSTGYIAPLHVYSPLQEEGLAHPGDTVCLGKEWYRFPSSYFLPDGVKAKFVKSEFSGLLPGEFSEAKVGFGFFPGAWLTPPGMNDENREDPGKYVWHFHLPEAHSR